MAAVAGVVVLYLFELWATNRYITHFGYGPIGLSKTTSAMMLGAAVVQSALLYLIYRKITERQLALTSFVVLAAVVMAVASFFAICAQGDAFAYISYAKLGGFRSGYAPPVPYHPAAGFASMWINLPPSVYGPLWALINWLTLAWVPNLAVAFFVLRVSGIVLIAIMALALRKLDVGEATMAVALLNPFLYFYYVAEAHNDLFPIVLVLLGAAIAERRPIAGALVAGCAGLAKLSFVLIAAVALNFRTTLSKRFLQLGLLVATTFVFSAMFGGSQYLHAVLQTGSTQFERGSDPRLHLVFQLSHVALWIIATLATGCAVFANAFLPTAAYAFYGVASNFSPWYLGWGIPYAVRVPTFTATYLAALPAVGVAVDPLFTFYPAHPWLLADILNIAIVITVVTQLLARLKRTREVGITRTELRSHQ